MKYKRGFAIRVRNMINLLSKTFDFISMARAGLGPSPGWGPYGPIGPLWAHMGPILFKKSLISMKNDKIVNKDIKGIKS